MLYPQHGDGRPTSQSPAHKIKVVYREPVTGPQSPGIMHRKSAFNNKLAPKPTPKPNPNPTLTHPNLNPNP